MTALYGWAGRVLRVNLSTGRITTEPTEAHTEVGPGGRGLGQWVLFREVEPGTDPLGPENKLIFNAGPLVGSLAPTAARVSIDTKNPQTGGIATTNVGGHFGPELKYAGFDSVIVEGQAETPVVLIIKDGQAELRPADLLWGRTTWETETALKAELGDTRWRLACIGPAGERLVHGASVIVDRGRAAGRSGAGTVMGAKRLKAIAVRGTGALRVYAPEVFLERVTLCWRKYRDVPAGRTMRKGGTHLAYGAGGPSGYANQPVRNYRDEYWPPEKAKAIAYPVFREQYEVRRLSCFNCPLYCSHFYRVDQGSYAGTACEGMQANQVKGFGSNLEIQEPAALVKMVGMCNELGLDSDAAAVFLGWAFELYERGLINQSDTGGLELNWGNHRAAVALIEDIVYRRRFGAVLALGLRQAAEVVGQGSERYAMQVKGAELNEGGMRFNRAWALGIVASTRGGGHLDGASTMGFYRIPPEKGEALFGTPTAGDPLVYEENAKVVLWFENLKAAVDSLGMCYFGSTWTDPDLVGPEDYAALFSSATGQPTSPEELLFMGRRVHNVEKAFNTLHAGFTRADDQPPRRLVEDPALSGPYQGERLDPARWEAMLDEYYRQQNWDVATGWQTEAGLRALGLDEVAARLRAAGRIAQAEIV